MTPMMVLWLACNPPPPPLLVLAPSSTQVPIERLTRDWAASAQTEATVIFDDSASLARMVDGGTPADLLLLSDATRMDDLVCASTSSNQPAPRSSVRPRGRCTTTASAPQDLRALLEDDHVLLVPPADSAEALRLQMHLESVEAWDALEPRIRHLHDEEAVLAGLSQTPTRSASLRWARASAQTPRSRSRSRCPSRCCATRRRRLPCRTTRSRRHAARVPAIRWCRSPIPCPRLPRLRWCSRVRAHPS